MPVRSRNLSTAFRITSAAACGVRATTAALSTPIAYSASSSPSAGGSASQARNLGPSRTLTDEAACRGTAELAGDLWPRDLRRLVDAAGFEVYLKAAPLEAVRLIDRL